MLSGSGQLLGGQLSARSFSVGGRNFMPKRDGMSHLQSHSHQEVGKAELIWGGTKTEVNTHIR